MEEEEEEEKDTTQRKKRGEATLTTIKVRDKIRIDMSTIRMMIPRIIVES
jgi:hypothetical protein